MRCAPTASLRVLAFGLVALASLGSAQAQERSWRLELDGVFTQVRGHDQELGSLNVEDAGGIPVLESEASVFSELDSDMLVHAGLERRLGRWGWALNGWWYDGADGSVDRVVSSDSANAVVVTVTTEALLPEVTAPDVASGQLKLRGTNHFEARSLDAEARRELAGGDRGAFLLSAGLRLTGYRDERVESLGIRDNGSRRHAHVGVLRSSLLLGPVFGFHGDVRVGRHRFAGGLTQAIVFGAVDRDARYEEVAGGQLQRTTDFSDGRDVAIPLTELRLKWSFDLTSRWSFGAGFFGSIWWNAPVAPIGATPVGPAQTPQQTLSIAGPMLTLTWTTN